MEARSSRRYRLTQNTFPVNTTARNKNPHTGQMSTAARHPPIPRPRSFIPIHFNYAVIPTFFPVSRLAQPGNLQLILPHLRPSSGGGRETSSNGMKCHSVAAFVTAMLSRPDGRGSKGLVSRWKGVCVCCEQWVYVNRQQHGVQLCCVSLVHSWPSPLWSEWVTLLLRFHV